MSENKNKKVPPVIYGLAVLAAVIGALIFNPAENERAIQQQTELITSVLSETTASATEAAAEIITETAPPTVSETVASEESAVSETQQEAVSYYFRNSSTLDSHYEKHGIEMGFSSAEEYEAAASAVINSPDALYKTEKEDGDGVYYIESTNEFAVLSTDGYIRTYFYPSAGKAYFDRQ